MPSKPHRWSPPWRRPRASPGRNSSSHPPLPSQIINAPSAPNATSAPVTSTTDPLDGFLNRALGQLNAGQQKTIQEYTTEGVHDIDSVVSRAQDAAVEKRNLCEAKQWTVANIGGRKIKLRQTADRIVELLDKFKVVGDVASNADPIHAGLPWAGVRLILEVAVSEHRQMSALLAGMEMVLYLAKRLQAYLTHLHRVPAGLERTNLEDALVDFYACILGFLAGAIEAFGKSMLSRVLDAFLSWDTYTSFQEKCFRLAERTETEARTCDRLLDQHDRGELENVLRRLEKLQVSVNINQVNIDLSLLPVAEGAEFDSYDEQHLAYCYPDTREDLLRDIYDWAADPNGKTIFWLNGMAGTGKSTISRTVAKHWQDKQRLGATFFFKRGEGNRGHGRHFFTTLVFQLFHNMPELQEHIADILQFLPNIAGKSLQQQFEKLFLDCFTREAASNSTPSGAAPTLLVVDALDECEKSDVAMILNLLRRGPSKAKLRIFLTSRPDLPVRLGFGGMDVDRYQDLILHEISQLVIEHDIKVLFCTEFDKIRAAQAKRRLRYPIPADWPDQNQLKTLTQRSVPLFIYAATVCRFVADERGDPMERLNRVLRQQAVSSTLDQTYMPVLEQICVDGEDDPEVEEIKWLLGVIAVLEEPLSIASIARLLGLDERDVAHKLDLFHSVLWIPDDRDSPVRLIHLSFREFLVQKKNTRMRHRFAVPEEDIHNYLVLKSLDLLKTHLHRDMCSLGKPGCRRGSVPKQTITDAFSPDVSYACRYWTHHFCAVSAALSPHVERPVHAFLQVHLLHWLESLSWLGQSSESVVQITSMLFKVRGSTPEGNEYLQIAAASSDSLTRSEWSTRLYLFLEDARRFTLTNRWIIDSAPLQLYASCLLFAPDRSIVKDHLRTDIMLDLAFLPNVTYEWSLELQRLENGSSAMREVVFSPDGRILASASENLKSKESIVTLWNVTTGKEMLILEHESRVVGIAISPDGARLVSGSAGGHVRVWEICDGKIGYEFTTPGGIESFACHPSFEEVALTVEDALYVCCITTGEIRHTSFHKRLKEVAYSSDGRTIALCSYLEPRVLIIQSTATGKRSRHEVRHEIARVALSPDGSKLAVGTIHGRVALSDTTLVGKVTDLHLHCGGVAAISFSPSGDLVATGSSGGSIYLCRVATGELMAQLDAHSDMVIALSFSRDETLIASACMDGTACIWNIGHAEMEGLRQRNPRREKLLFVKSPAYRSMAFSSDGRQAVAGPFDNHGLIYNTLTGERIEVGTDGDPLRNVSVSPNCKHVACVYGTKIKLYNAASGDFKWEIQARNPKNTGFSPDNTLVVFTTFQKVTLVATTSGQTIYCQKVEWGICQRKLRISRDNRMLACSGEDAKEIIIHCWDLETRTEVSRLVGHRETVLALAFSSDAQYVASASIDRTVRLWKVSTGFELWRLKDQSLVDELMFSANDRCLETDQGVIDVEQSGLSVMRETDTRVTDDWIRRDGQDLIWLPHPFRYNPRCVRHNVVGLMTWENFGLILIRFRT